MKFVPYLLLFALTAGCAPRTPAIEIGDAWARATAPGQSSAAIYATIVNHGSADRLVGVSSDSGMAMLHTSASELRVVVGPRDARPTQRRTIQRGRPTPYNGR